MSKAKVLSVIDKKINSVDTDSKTLEKSFFKGTTSTKDFLEEYLGKRKAFHKYQIMKVRVSQC